MKRKIKQIIKSITPIVIINLFRKIRNNIVINNWRKKNSPFPPPKYVKHKLIAEFQKSSGAKVLVETGTFLGEMIEVQYQNFDRFYSIELAEKLYKDAQWKFRKKENVMLLNGDSGELMPVIMKEIKEPSIFWLDAHYCGGLTALSDVECPIYKELDAVFTTNYKHILLIDDARYFIGKKDYPTENKLKEYLDKKGVKYNYENKDDVIRIVIK